MILFATHIACLVLPGYLVARWSRLPFVLTIGTMFLVFETSLIVGAGLLSWAALLGNLTAYRMVTTVCAIGIAAILWSISRLGPDAIAPAFVSEPPPTAARRFRQAAAMTTVGLLAVFAGLMLLLALNAYPSVEDSLTIKLPKIVFAIQSNSILPTNFSDDTRMYMSPVYPVLIQLPLIISDYKGHALLVFGFVHWAICGIALYGICRFAGATPLSSLVVTALVMLAPTLIVQGTSEGDDIIAATPAVVGLLFLIPALIERRPVYAVLAGLGFGLSFAMKFLPLFYVPAAVVLAAFLILTGRIKWLRDRIYVGLWFASAFVCVLLPNAIANKAGFGSFFHVSPHVSARNWPFDLECALRSSVGHLKQLLLSDMIRLVSRFWPTPTGPASRYEAVLANIQKTNEFVATALPFDPVSRCTAYGAPYMVTHPLLTDNTLWFGLVGPLLLVSAVIAVCWSRLHPVARAIGLGFLGWILTFDFTQRYYGENGRFWSVAVLCGSAVIAVVLDHFIKRRVLRPVAISVMALAALTTVVLGAVVLHENYHRALPASLRNARYADNFSPDLAAHLHKAKAVNVQVFFGTNTYDYYMLLGPEGKLWNKVALVEGALNIVGVRPFGVLDNPYVDPRVPVRMATPVAGAFRLFPSPPGQILPFVNNTELTETGSAKSRSSFLIFELQRLKSDGQEASGYVHHIGTPEIVAAIRYRVGWREPDGALVMTSGWSRGLYAEFKVPTRATKLVVEAAIEGEAKASSSEWPMKQVDLRIGETLRDPIDQ